MRLEPQSPHVLGYALVAFGAAVAAFFWFIMDNVPLTALGIGMAVVGSSLAITPLSPLPSATVRRMLEGSLLNIEALLEELGASTKGYYVPKADGSVQVYVPMGKGSAASAAGSASARAGADSNANSNANSGSNANGNADDDASANTNANTNANSNSVAGDCSNSGSGAPPLDAPVDGLITKVGGMQYLVIFPPASALMKNLPPDEGGAGAADLEGAISEAVVDEAGLADSLRVTETGRAVTVEISSPKSKAGAGRVRHVMGSLEAGIAAAVAARARGRAVRVVSEEDAARGRKRKVTLALC